MKNSIKILFSCFVICSIFYSCSKESLSSGTEVKNSGQGGSLAKFTIQNNYMYTVEGTSLKVYDVANTSKTALVNTINLNNPGVETIFCYNQYLFFGTQNGMLIYSLSNPANPAYISTYSHIVSCDPVVVSGNLAYVTLSSGTRCNRGMNQLEIIDISNIYNPKLLKFYPMGTPKGLAIAGKYLYLCDQLEGFKVFDVTDPLNAIEVNKLPNLLALDVIASGNILTITGPTGVYQYDCTDPLNLKLLSKINVTK